MVEVAINLVPRVFSYLPHGARETETLVNAGHVSPRSGRLQTNYLGKGQVSVRFVPTDRRQVSLFYAEINAQNPLTAKR